ncbi:MAG: type II toxin-antitoxin system RelB/DinJ family antitoxin [Chloroflexi bacterium]|nr:type II toxin-antitoxin system RelB/DinJ family antitoxin [Chloroflexota bacterium]
MAKTTTISVRIDPETKKGAELVFKKLGLTASQAITLFYQQAALQQGLPFLTLTPHDLTAEILENARSRSDLKEFDTIEDLLKDLESDD